MSTTGKFSWAILLCKFSDRAQEPHPRQFFINLISGNLQQSLSDYWRTKSYGNLDMSNVTVYDWASMFSVAHDQSYAALSRWEKTEKCIDAVAAALGNPLLRAELEAYDGIIVVVNDTT